MQIHSLPVSGCIKVIGDRPGPKLLIFGAIHGDEPCGALAVRRFLFELYTNKFEVVAGEVELIIANEEALEQNKRYLEKNLNRLFRDDILEKDYYESLRAQELKDKIREADYFLDIHSTSKPTAPFLFAEKHLLDQAKLLGVPNIVLGWNDMPGIDLGGDTESYGNQHQTISFTVECGQNFLWTTWEYAYQVLLNFLYIHGAIDLTRNVSNYKYNIFQMFEVVKLMGPGFIYNIESVNFASLKKGQVIAHDATKQYIAPQDCVLVMPGTPENTALGEEIYFLANKL